MYFEIIGNITDIEPIAIGSSIRQLEELRKQYGEANLLPKTVISEL